MAQSIIELTREQGKAKNKAENKRNGKHITKLLQSRFSAVPESFTNEINLIQSLEQP